MEKTCYWKRENYSRPAVTSKWYCCCALLLCSRTSGTSKAALFLFFLDKVTRCVMIRLEYYGWDSYLAGDVRGHGWWRLWVSVGILGDKTRVMGGDAAEPMGSCRGHLEKAVDRISHQYVTQHMLVKQFRIVIIKSFIPLFCSKDCFGKSRV